MSRVDRNLAWDWFGEGAKPDPDYTINKWADERRILPSKSSAEPGRYRTSRMPYLKEPMEVLSPSSPVEQIKVIKGTQLGWTEIGNNWILCTIDLYPAPMLMVMPTGHLAEKHSKQKIAPSILLTPTVQEKVASATSRGSGNTIAIKEFVGGLLVMTGANTGASFRSSSYKNVFLDDVDGFPLDVEGEGSPLDLARNRTDAFANRKIYINSTPTVKGRSNIEKEFEHSDQREYFVPCPECGNMDTIKWSNMVFEHDKQGIVGEVCLKCENCGVLISEGHKTSMLEGGEWIAQNEGHQYAGFKLSSLYSPVGFVSWAKIASEFLEAKKATELGDMSKMKRWINTRLAEVWEEDYEVVDATKLLTRKEDYSATVPEGVYILTAGVDTQDDRLEVEIVGWGKYEESWSINYHIILGDPKYNEVWQKLDEILFREYMHESGNPMRIVATCVDTGGHRTEYVYKYCKARYSLGVYAIKGAGGLDTEVASRIPTRKNKGNVNLFRLGVNKIKDHVYAHLQTEHSGPGYMHYPNHEVYSEIYFAQFEAERRNDKGLWVAVGHRRNEAFDNRVYAYGAKRLSGFNIDTLSVPLFAGSYKKKRRVIHKGKTRDKI